MESWNQVELLFLAASELPPSERAAFLDQHTEPNSALRHEVESLLSYDSAGSQPFAPIVQDSAISMVLGETLRDDRWVGRRIGPWRIISSLGQGGMGAVFLADRADDQFQKKVAIKFIRSGFGQKDVEAGAISRFLRERQILANFDHPNISRLIDGGATEEGIPYFVMEYVAGTPIDFWCESQHLPVNRICELFCQVCDAVAYAHRNLVVHRDLKPTNILVSTEGIPVLLDFGIARLLDHAAAGDYTQTAMFALTPEYASPEQIRGLPATTSTDVYSLGVIFYRLLTAAQPYKVNSTSVLAIERSVCEQQPLPPSESAPQRRIPADLDNIVLMALRKEPERRYNSADQFAEDVRRYLRGLPVIAREDSFFYRAEKFIRRNRGGVLVGAAAALGLLVATVVAVQAARRAEQARLVAVEQRSVAVEERERAEREHLIAERERDSAAEASTRASLHAQEADTERARAQKRLKDLLDMSRTTLFEIQGTLEHLPGAINARRDVIVATLKYLDSLAASSPGDPELAAMLVSGYTQMGDVLGYPGRANLGNTQGAIEAWRKASAILSTLKSNGLRHRLQESGLHQRVGAVQESSGKLPEAVHEYQSALAIAKTLTRDFPHNAVALSQEGIYEHNLFTALSVLKDPTALDHSLRAIEAHQRALKADPSSDDVRMGLASDFSSRAVAFTQMGRLAEAESEFRKSLAMRQALQEQHPNDVFFQSGLARAWLRLAVLQGAPWSANLGNPGAAAESAAKAFAIYEKLALSAPSDQKAKGDYAQALVYAGILIDPPAETTRLRRAVALLNELRAAQPNVASYRSDAALAHEYLGNRLRDAGDLAGAAAEYRLSMEAQKRPSVTAALAKLGEK